jgi:pyridoxine 4-dehydrogenase
VTVAQLEEARGIVAVVSVQNRFNLVDRLSEGVLDACEREGLAFFPWRPLAAGKLAKPGGPV